MQRQEGINSCRAGEQTLFSRVKQVLFFFIPLSGIFCESCPVAYSIPESQLVKLLTALPVLKYLCLLSFNLDDFYSYG